MEDINGFVRLLNDPANIRLCIRALRDTQQQIIAKQKQCRIFNLVYDNVKVNNNKILYAQTQLLRRIRAEEMENARQAETLQGSRKHIELELNLLEDNLTSARQHAQLRRDKRNKRESQYNSAYNLPVMSNYWEKKYLRARDKNATAEQAVCDMRDRYEQCREELHNMGRELGKIQSASADLQQQKEEAEATAAKIQALTQKLSQANNYWTHFAQGPCQELTSAISDFIVLLERQKDGHDIQATFYHLINSNNVYLEECHYGDTSFGDIELDYVCSRCEESQHGWPLVDKVRTQDLLCPMCYKETRMSMVVEKKVNALGGKLLGSDTSLNSFDIRRLSVPIQSQQRRSSALNLRRKSGTSDIQSIESIEKPRLKRNLLKSMFNISTPSIYTSSRTSSFYSDASEKLMT
ncbi:hypothetical protein NQZ79_g7996 [Umbelopsis isabellina]|nr:hypothetical protein NQZ79_g7996 [Umbelopsis isabellina]